MNFIDDFYNRMDKHEPNFEIAGFLTRDDNVYPLSTDTKVLSTAFELIVRPIIYDIANSYKLEVYEPQQQNYYPDFTLMTSEDDDKKIAIDVKTTYRSFLANGEWRAKFTLGSFVSFLRSETKNIAYPFSDYEKHYIIGFIYTREPIGKVHVFDIEERHDVAYPITDIEYFAQEKYKIASGTTGSGNTENIGSITARSIREFMEGTGPFSTLGEDVFIDYWRNFPKYREKGGFRNLKQYFEWKKS